MLTIHASRWTSDAVGTPASGGLADLVERPGERNARIVEHQIDATVLGHDRVWQGGNRRAIGDVEPMAGDADAGTVN